MKEKLSKKDLKKRNDDLDIYSKKLTEFEEKFKKLDENIKKFDENSTNSQEKIHSKHSLISKLLNLVGKSDDCLECPLNNCDNTIFGKLNALGLKFDYYFCESYFKCNEANQENCIPFCPPEANLINCQKFLPKNYNNLSEIFRECIENGGNLYCIDSLDSDQNSSACFCIPNPYSCICF